MAKYKFKLNHDLKKAEKNLKQYESYNTNTFSALTYTVSDSSITKSDTTMPNQVIQQYFSELVKATANNQSFLYTCSPSIIKKHPFQNLPQSFSDSDTYFKLIHTNTTNRIYYSSLSITSMTFAQISYDTKSKKTYFTCYNIDTGGQWFQFTGNTKKIHNWHCNEYKPTKGLSGDIKVWLSEEIPNYVAPQVVINGGHGGVVMIEFENGSLIVLDNISITKEKPKLQNCKNKNLPVYDPWNFFIRRL